jgi:hypothetical protein
MQALEIESQYRVISPSRACGCEIYFNDPVEGSWLSKLVAKSVPQPKRRHYLVVAETQGISIATEFASLVKQWNEETFALSSLTKKYNHPAYVRIMAMGKEGISMVLKELQQSGGRWFYALKFMAGENISEGIDNFEDAKAAWLEWGYKNNYL